MEPRENRNGKGNHRGNQWKMTVTTPPQMLSTCRYCHSIHSILLSTKEPKEPSSPISIQFIVFTRSHSPGQPSRQQSAFNIPFQSHFVHQPNSTERSENEGAEKSSPFEIEKVFLDNSRRQTTTTTTQSRSVTSTRKAFFYSPH